MDSSTAFSYVYAKASGMLAKSFSGNNAQKLFDAKSLDELWTLIFPGEEVPDVPEKLLAKKIESCAEEKFIRDYAKLVEYFESPDEVLIWLLRSFDVENLKEIAASIVYKDENPPKVANIGSYSLLDFKKWPDLKKITENSDFSWCDETPDVEEIRNFDASLDKFYVKKIFSCAKDAKGDGKDDVLKLVTQEFSMQNILWALRLKVYYKMNDEQIIPLLAYAERDGDKKDVLVKGAIDVLNRNVEKIEDWRTWKYNDCVNPNENGETWKIDPRWVEQKMIFKLNEKVRKNFHKHSSSTAALYAWFKIKKTEVDYIRKAAEGLRLGVEGGINV